MIGYKTSLACILAIVSPVVAAVAGWVWGIFEGTAPPASAAGQCAGCGYDLTGNVSGICPECGLKVVIERSHQVDVTHPADLAGAKSALVQETGTAPAEDVMECSTGGQPGELLSSDIVNLKIDKPGYSPFNDGRFSTAPVKQPAAND